MKYSASICLVLAFTSVAATVNQKPLSNDPWIDCYDSEKNTIVKSQRCLVRIAIGTACTADVTHMWYSQQPTKKSIHSEEVDYRNRVVPSFGEVDVFHVQCYGDLCSSNSTFITEIWTNVGPTASYILPCYRMITADIDFGIQSLIRKASKGSDIFLLSGISGQHQKTIGTSQHHPNKQFEKDGCTTCVELFQAIITNLKIEAVCEENDNVCRKKNLENINGLLRNVEAYLSTGGNPCDLERYRLIRQALENRKLELQRASESMLQELFKAKLEKILITLNESAAKDDTQVADARKHLKEILEATE